MNRFQSCYSFFQSSSIVSTFLVQQIVTNFLTICFFFILLLPLMPFFTCLCDYLHHYELCFGLLYFSWISLLFIHFHRHSVCFYDSKVILFYFIFYIIFNVSFIVLSLIRIHYQISLLFLSRFPSFHLRVSLFHFDHLFEIARLLVSGSFNFLHNFIIFVDKCYDNNDVLYVLYNLFTIFPGKQKAIQPFWGLVSY